MKRTNNKKTYRNKFTKEMVREAHALVNDLGMSFTLAAQVVANNHGLIEKATSDWMTTRDKGYH